MALSMRTIARECLNKFGTVSAQRDILALRQLPPPRSLRDELDFHPKKSLCTRETLWSAGDRCCRSQNQSRRDR